MFFLFQSSFFSQSFSKFVQILNFIHGFGEMTYTNIDHKSSLFLNVTFKNQAPDLYGVHMYQDFSVVFNYETLSRSSFNVTPKTKFAELRGIGMTIRRRRR